MYKNYFIFQVPAFSLSLTKVNKTGTTITVSWTTNSTDADGYVVNATSDTNTVTQQVKGGHQSTAILKGLSVGTTYNIIIRAYQDILGPVSNTISVQTNPGFHPSIHFNNNLLLKAVILSINWTLDSSITELEITQYRIGCHTTVVNPTTDVYWLVNGVMKNSSMYTLIDDLIYNNTLLVYPDPLGVSVNVTCIAMYEGVKYSNTLILQGM